MNTGKRADPPANIILVFFKAINNTDGNIFLFNLMLAQAPE